MGNAENFSVARAWGIGEKGNEWVWSDKLIPNSKESRVPWYRTLI